MVFGLAILVLRYMIFTSINTFDSGDLMVWGCQFLSYTFDPVG